MTFKEWMQENRPELVSKVWGGGVFSCPHQYDLETKEESRRNCGWIKGGKGCEYCWNREMPTKVTIVEQEIVEPEEGFKGPKGCPKGEPGERGDKDAMEQMKPVKSAVRMPKLSTGTRLRIIAGIMAKYRENANRENLLYCDGIIDAVCSVMSFQEEEEYDV